MDLMQAETIKPLPNEEIEKVKAYVREHVGKQKLEFRNQQRKHKRTKKQIFWSRVVTIIIDLIIVGIITYFAFKKINDNYMKTSDQFYLDPFFGAAPKWVPFALFLGIFGLSLLFILPSWRRNNRVKPLPERERLILKKQIDPNFRHDIFKKWFNNQYKDIQVEKLLTKNEIAAHMSRFKNDLGLYDPSKGSRVMKVWPGYRLKTSLNIFVDTFIMNTKQVYYQINRGKRERKVAYYTRFMAIIDNKRVQWEDVEFAIAPRMGDDPPQTELENPKFNSKWSYQANDDVKLRMILTPWTQEKLASKNILPFAMQKLKDIIFWNGIYKFENNIFEWDISFGKTLEQTINKITKDVVDDINIFLYLIHNLSFYKTIFN